MLPAAPPILLGTAGTFLHSPPMVESSARSARPRLFLSGRGTLPATEIPQRNAVGRSAAQAGQPRV